VLSTGGTALAAVATSVAVAAAACASTGPARPAVQRAGAASCGAFVTAGGRRYQGARRDFAALGLTTTWRRVEVTVPGCGGPATTERFWALEGLPAKVALAPERVVRDELFVAPGSFLVIDSHPLHRAYYEPGEPRRRRCAQRMTYHRRVREVPATIPDGIRLRGLRPLVRIDARTVFHGRAKVPTVEAGDLIVIRAARCPGQAPLALSMRLGRP
jgi:hypothetical protein